MLSTQFFEKGWCRFPFSEELAEWVTHSLHAARVAVRAPEYREWWRCGGTWFAGVNALANDEAGATASGPPLAGPAIDFLRRELGFERIAWDRGQVSVCYPGYPQPMQRESEAAFRYRRERAAAHIDGTVPEGPERRRHLRHYHAFILGIPMVEVSGDAAPFTLWEGSHEQARQAFGECFATLPPERWGDEDITESYVAMRRAVFDTCRRIEITAKPGEAYLVHRLALHGIAPWGVNARAGADGRMICYFRPESLTPRSWLSAA